MGAIPANEFLPAAFDYAVADSNTVNYKALIDYGFPLGSKQFVTVSSPGATYVGGIADSVKIGNIIKFTGRCVVFTHPQSLEQIASTVAHEFTHSLGIAHNCGYDDYKGVDPCAMVYSSHWIRNASGILDPWSNRASGNDLCAEHIMIIRETHLEDDGPGLKLGW